MFGYIQANNRELKIKDFETYRSYYCGLCHTLKKRYGRRGQLLLNYDMTFLALVLTGLYEPEEAKTRRRCALHPGRAHEETESAADVCAHAFQGYRRIIRRFVGVYHHSRHRFGVHSQKRRR